MAAAKRDASTVERVQTGVRIEKRLLKVLKALAEYHDISLGDLLEAIVLHVFEGRLPFDEKMRQRIVELKRLYDLDLQATSSHRYWEREQDTSRAAAARRPAPRPAGAQPKRKARTPARE